MFRAAQGTRVYLGLGKTDLRKAINGLSILVQERMELDPFSGHYFAFCNRRRKLLKILYWDRNGFALWHKRLERDRFIWPRSEQEVLEIRAEELDWLLAGLDFRRAHRAVRYSTLR
jgi:transposase